ncbi:hypothetical protein, partial [Pseudomonas typographi]
IPAREGRILMTNHIERTGRALQVLWDHFRNWELFATGTRAPILDRWYIATKTKALIKHDRILRGAA